MAMSGFARETAIVAEGAGRWRCRLDDAWNIGATPNGGYALTPVLRAMRELAGKPDPLAVTAHFLRPARAGTDAVVEGQLLRQGRSTATVTASLVQDDAQRVVVIAAFGDVTTGAAEPNIALPPPDDLPPPEACVPRSELQQGVELAIASRLAVRVHPADAASATSATAQVRGWIRFLDHTAPDTMALPLFADAFPPAVFPALGRVGWVPTVELTVHVRRRPVPGWIRAWFVCDDLSGGRLIETGVLWDDTGAVVARSRQLGLLLTDPPGPP